MGCASVVRRRNLLSQSSDSAQKGFFKRYSYVLFFKGVYVGAAAATRPSFFSLSCFSLPRGRGLGVLLLFPFKKRQAPFMCVLFQTGGAKASVIGMWGGLGIYSLYMVNSRAHSLIPLSFFLSLVTYK